MMRRRWWKDFSHRGDIVIALLVAIVATVAPVVFGVFQLRQTSPFTYEIFDNEGGEWRRFIGDLRFEKCGDLATVSWAMEIASYMCDNIVDLDEVPKFSKSLVQAHREHSYAAESYRVRAGWPFRIVLLEGHHPERFSEIELGWTGGAIIRNGTIVDHAVYRPSILMSLVNVVVVFVPTLLLFGLIRTQIALIRAARGNCTACGYPRPKTICPECGQEH
jgi:hypothetical protein